MEEIIEQSAVTELVEQTELVKLAEAIDPIESIVPPIKNECIEIINELRERIKILEIQNQQQQLDSLFHKTRMHSCGVIRLGKMNFRWIVLFPRKPKEQAVISILSPSLKLKWSQWSFSHPITAKFATHCLTIGNVEYNFGENENQFKNQQIICLKFGKIWVGLEATDYSPEDFAMEQFHQFQKVNSNKFISQ